MYSDANYAEQFQYIKDDIYKSLGVDADEIQSDPNIQLLELISDPEFRRVTEERDYEQLIQILVDKKLLNSDDINNISTKYESHISNNMERYQDVFSGKDGLNKIDPNFSVEPQCVTCISFAGVAVNIAAATNVIAAVVVAVYTAAWVWGGGGGGDIGADGGGGFVGADVGAGGFVSTGGACIPHKGQGCPVPDELPITKEKPFGAVALTDQKIADTKKVVSNAAFIAGFPDISDHIYRDLAKTEIEAFYLAAFNLGLIDSEERKDAIIRQAKLEIEHTTLLPEEVSNDKYAK